MSVAVTLLLLGQFTMLLLVAVGYADEWLKRGATRAELFLTAMATITWPVSLVAILIVVAVKRTKESR